MPPGCTTDAAPFGSGGGWGSSWMVFLLPQVEQQNIFANWQFTGGNSGYVNANNRAISTTSGTGGPILKTYRCPATNLPKYAQNSPSLPMLATYVGISGAANGTIPGYNESRIDNSGTGVNCCSGGGPASAGGTFYRGSQTRLSELKDGTSNTMVVSEHGDLFVTQDGSKRFWSAGGLYGWSMGANTNSPPNNPAATASDNRQFNCTTIRYAINQTTGWPNTFSSSTQNGDCTLGVCYDMGNNIPLNSGHSNGVNALYGDGSVHFLPNSTSVQTLAQLAVRDDGIPLSNLP